jgi:hypothetical protein
MTAGYIIPTPFDIHFEFGADGVFKFESQWKAMSAHYPSQVAGTPLARAVLIKIHSPWVLRTPAGYSTLFTPPINRFESPIQPLIGVVETDGYYREVHLPSIYGLGRGSRYTLRQGAPLVQVIPFAREAWRSAVIPLDPRLRNAADEPFLDDRDAYKQKHWVKLEYQ